MSVTRVEQDSLGSVNVPVDKLWGAQTQRSLEHFSIGDDLIPREMIPAYAIVKKAAALVNLKAGRLGDTQKELIVRVCDEHRDVATASLIEVWIDETERRTWFLFEARQPERTRGH